MKDLYPERPAAATEGSDLVGKDLFVSSAAIGLAAAEFGPDRADARHSPRPNSTGVYQPGLRLGRPRYLAHQLMNIAFAVLECRHPQVVVRHWRDQPRCRYDVHALFQEPLVSGIDIRDAKIKDRAGVIVFRRRRRAEHQPHASAVEKRHARNREEQAQSQDVAVKCRRALDVLYDDRNLSDVGNSQASRRSAHFSLPPP